ncbi:L-2,4-diaminobutyric acid acetyltransferase [Desulfarculus baarsii DSM 2075]|uniref:L-2,4-diaminobutyric acid acetyltransferase n=2 Tax=Desulfarculus baarsii TaxID=453230 RepID=E1QGN3_DESB2|nr:L-2,4-diaminobutyric acid acetyltransferase [Desulfarculus baarsii DSM 2075]
MEPLIRIPTLADGAAVHEVVLACPELDANSRYAYALLCHEFDQTARVAEIDGVVVGFVCGFRPPRRPRSLFVWQVATLPAARGLGLAGCMIEAIVADSRANGQPIDHLEATVAEHNLASRRLFAGLARRLGAPLAVEPYITAETFGAMKHPAEPLIRIGPITNQRGRGG